EHGMHAPLHPESYNLNQAIVDGDERRVYSLLNDIRDGNSRDGSGASALDAAATEPRDLTGFGEKIGIVQRTGQTLDEYYNSLCSISLEIRLRIVGALFQHGARADGDGGLGWTPLLNAI